MINWIFIIPFLSLAGLLVWPLWALVAVFIFYGPRPIQVPMDWLKPVGKNPSFLRRLRHDFLIDEYLHANGHIKYGLIFGAVFWIVLLASR